LGDRTLPAPLPPGGGRRGQAQIAHEGSGRLKAGEGTQGGHGRNGDGALPTAQGLRRVDPGGEAPGLALLLAFWFATLPPFRLCVDRAEICLAHDGLSRARPAPCREPPEVSRVPRSRAWRAEGVPQPQGVQTPLSGCESTETIFTSPPPRTPGFICALGALDGSEVSRAHQPGQWEGGAALGVAPISRVLRAQRGSNAPAVLAFCGQIAIEPIATRTRGVDTDEACGLRLPLPPQCIDGALARADGAAIDDVGTIGAGGLGHRDGFFMNIHAHIKRARLCHG
jgi:hypothetical protein